MSELRNRESLYENFRHACSTRGTNVSAILRECGRSTGNTGAWKAGAFPRLDVAMDIADYLGISLDELCYGVEGSKAVIIDDSQREWLEIALRIPEDKQQMCKDFLKTHAVIPEKYEGQKKTS